MRSQPVPHLFLSILTGAYRCRILPLVVLPDTLPARSASRSRLADWHPARHCGRKGNDAARPARHWWVARHQAYRIPCYIRHIALHRSASRRPESFDTPKRRTVPPPSPWQPLLLYLRRYRHRNAGYGLVPPAPCTSA